jgi:hypothetical protein
MNNDTVKAMTYKGFARSPTSVDTNSHSGCGIARPFGFPHTLELGSLQSDASSSAPYRDWA